MSTQAISTDVQAPPAGVYKADPAHTSIGFVARHLMVTKVRGRFSDFDATIHVADDPEQSWAEAAINVASIDTGNDGRDGHLRSPDFFDAERFPVMRFRSTKLERAGDDRLKVTGDLTIRDVTRPVVLDVEYNGWVVDHNGAPRVSLTATTTVDREEWGLTWNQVIEGVGVMVSKKVTLELEVAAVRQP